MSATMAPVIPGASEAMTRERFYSNASNPTQALSRIYSWRSRLFDGRLVNRFIKALGVYPPGSMVELADGRLAIVTMINPENRTRPVLKLLKDGQHADDSEVDLMQPQHQALRILRTLDETELMPVPQTAASA